MVNAAGFCENILKMSYEDAAVIICELIKLSFKPLKLFPATGGTEKLIFDADWITSIITKVHKVTGYSPEYILNELSLTACCYYFAQYARLQGSNNIHRRTDEEILILQMKRSVDLICDRLIELNVFTKEERSKYRKIMLTPTK